MNTFDFVIKVLGSLYKVLEQPIEVFACLGF